MQSVSVIALFINLPLYSDLFVRLSVCLSVCLFVCFRSLRNISDYGQNVFVHVCWGYGSHVHMDVNV